MTHSSPLPDAATWTIAEVVRLLHDGDPSDEMPSTYAEYAPLIDELHHAWHAWHTIAAEIEALGDNFNLKLFEMLSVKLDDLGGRSSAQAAVSSRWRTLRGMAQYAAIDIGVGRAIAERRRDTGDQFSLAKVLSLLAAANDVIRVKQLLRDVVLDAADWSDTDMLALADALQHKYGLAQVWIRDWQRGVKALNAPIPASTSATAGAAPVPPDAKYLIDANCSDTGTAECLARLYGDHLRYCGALPKGSKWFVWDGQRWKADCTGEAERLTVATARARFSAGVHIQNLDERKKYAGFCVSGENTKGIANTLSAAANLKEFATQISQYDTDPMLAATSTGTLDLRTQDIYPPDRSDYLTMSLGAAYDKHADCPLWETFLNEVFSGDQELIKFIQRAIGYTLTGDMREQCMFLCFGEGANGKSVFLDTLSALMGDFAGNTPFTTFDEEQRAGVGEFMAVLRGKRLVTAIETGEDKRLDEAKVKAVTGGDVVTCRQLHANPFTFQPTFKIWMAMNHKPVIRGTDTGIWRRVRLVPFDANFEGRANKNLAHELRQELPGILNWALDGVVAWRKNELGTCKAVESATKQYKSESDQVGRWLDECTIATPHHLTPADTAYVSYTSWCEEGGEKPETKIKWGRRLKAKGFGEGKTVNNQRTKEGFSLV